MSPLAREELLHFEKVMNFIKAKDIKFIGLKPARYSQTLHQQLSAEEGKHRLRDSLIIGAIIEARSCERFNALIPYLEDGALKRFYVTLVKSEARHFQDYLALAKHYAGDITKRLDELLTLENQLIVTEEAVFRFHSGIPLYISTD
jgi:tRNA-(ms[2]io[6]A)-hydroxylase